MTDTTPEQVPVAPDLTFTVTAFRTPAGQDASWSQYASGRLDADQAHLFIDEQLGEHQAATAAEALSGPVAGAGVPASDDTGQEQDAGQEQPQEQPGADSEEEPIL